jgi:hypothetical protein
MNKEEIRFHLRDRWKAVEEIERWVKDFAEVLETPDLWNEPKQILESEK